MKGVLFLALVCGLAAVSSGKYCNGTHYDDPSGCGIICPGAEVPSCEHGGICSCAKQCADKADCEACPSRPDIMHPGHMLQEETYCVNYHCTCDLPGHMPGNHPPDHHPGDHHHPGDQQQGGHVP